MVAVALSYDAHSREQPKDSVHRLCYTIPATDVAPPVGIEVLGLDEVRLKLDIGRKTRKKNHKRQKQTKTDQNGDRSGVEETNLLHSSMLFEPLLPVAIDEDAILHEPPIDSGYESLFSTQTSHGGGEDEMLLTGVEAIGEDEDDMLDLPEASTSSFSGLYSNLATTTELAPTVVKNSDSKKRSSDFPDASDQIEPVVISSDCIASLVDAVLRLSIEEKPWRLRQGLRVRSKCIVSRLSDISPGLWSPGYLQVCNSIQTHRARLTTAQEISTRAPLLPTVAHALSHSVYTNATSPTLKAKLQTLLYYSSDDNANGEADEELSVRGTDKIAPKTRFETMSALLWHAVQGRLYRPDTTRRLKSLTEGLGTSDEPEEDDEKLFSQDSSNGSRRRYDNDFMFEDDEGEEPMMDYEDFEENLHEQFLFETAHCTRDSAERDEDNALLQSHIAVEHVEGDETDLLMHEHTVAEGDEYDCEDLFGGCETIWDMDEDELLLQHLDR